jgi:acyl-coenzyme A synthetase/AMP-(fatty) acid ligase
VRGELEFRTSGSTGEPVRWLRSADQIRAEARLLARLCVPAGTDGLVCCAPAQHVYGHMMGRAVPEAVGLPCRQLALTESPAPALAGWRRAVIAAVPASFAQLARSLPALAALDEVVLVHSTAMLPPDASQLLDALAGRVRLVELLGSTETGLVAVRTGPERSEWTLAEDVRLRPGLEPGSVGALGVHSGRLARRPGAPFPDVIELDDVVRVLDPRTFRWLGRRGRLVKVNGRRIHLDAVEARLRQAAPGVRISCRPERDGLRGEWFAVVADSPEPETLEALRTACRTLPSWQRPRAIVPLEGRWAA